MLSSTRQAVLSTLIARGVSFKEADELVRGAPSGESFDATLQYALNAIARRQPVKPSAPAPDPDIISIDYTTPRGRFTQRVRLSELLVPHAKLSDLVRAVTRDV